LTEWGGKSGRLEKRGRERFARAMKIIESFEGRPRSRGEKTAANKH